MGIAPKDVDIYLNDTTQGNLEMLTAKAQLAGTALGRPNVVLLGRQDGVNNEGNDYPSHLTVFQMTSDDPTDLPYELIFTPRDWQPEFDIGICEISMLSTGRIFPFNAHTRDKENKTLTILRMRDGSLEQRFIHDELILGTEAFDKAYTRLKNHVDRIKAKYPDFTLVMDPGYAAKPEGQTVYNLLVEENYFGDPRAVLQAAGQEPPRDEIRQQDRDAFAQEIAGPQGRRNTQMFFDNDLFARIEARANAWQPAEPPAVPFIDDVEAGADPVPDPAPVPARPVVPRPRGRAARRG